MQDGKRWIAAVSMGLAASFFALAAHAQGCDAAALTCRAGNAADPAGGASFLDLIRAGHGGSSEHAATRDPLARPAVYLPDAAEAPSSDNMAPAGVGALDSVMGTQLSDDGEPAWLAFPKSIAAPDSSVAWIFAMGFLGFVVLRRVRGTNPY